MDNIVCGRYSVNQIIPFRRCRIQRKGIFRHLKLEIALGIPASNDQKYNTKQFSRTINCLFIFLMLTFFEDIRRLNCTVSINM